ncbi:MAG: dephospho-CoA kinase [Bacteroidetes bacterium]|nr:dephospho-CoA kinase [Bacteroidota bacterium]
MRKKIGLTGGIGSGKSIVAKIFEILGIPVFNADFMAKKIMNDHADIREKIIQIFGKEIYQRGQLDRAQLAAIVFNDKNKLSQLNSVIHPATIEAADKWMAEQSSPYMIKEAALLFEAGAEKNLDMVIGVYAPMNIRIQRIISRDQMSVEQAEERMKNQMDDQVKMSLCDHVIINDETQFVIPQILRIHQIILNTTKRIL